jgi:hypothetical protein
LEIANGGKSDKIADHRATIARRSRLRRPKREQARAVHSAARRGAIRKLSLRKRYPNGFARERLPKIDNYLLRPPKSSFDNRQSAIT